MKIIVICTGKPCRSQIAEGLLKAKHPNFEIYSAGTKPEEIVNPFAVKAMAEEGYDISSQYPKLVSDLLKNLLTMSLLYVIQPMNCVQYFQMEKTEYTMHLLIQADLLMIQRNHALDVYRDTVKQISKWIDSLNFI